MKTVFLASASLCLVLITGSAFAAEPKAKSDPVETAQFRVKVATCKVQARTDGVKTTTPDFYSYMGACLGRVTVTVNVAAK